MLSLLDALFPKRPDEQMLRNESAETFLRVYYPQTVPATRPMTVTLLPFSEPMVRAAVHETKYHGARSARRLLAHALATYLRTHESLDTVRLVPIPLGPQRLRERGFNQTEVLCNAARALLKKDGRALPQVTRLLVRTRDTPSQVSLPRHAREENMRGAFVAPGPIDPALLYIIVDDVLTTGATLQAAIDALSAGGAQHILPLTLAH